MVFITNEKNNIVVQSMNEDFHYKQINFMHNLIANINQLLESMEAHKEVKSMIMETYDDFKIQMKNLDLLDYGMKNLVVINQLESDKLSNFIDGISKTITLELKDKDFFS